MAFLHRKLLNQSDPDSICSTNYCDPTENPTGICPPLCIDKCPTCCISAINTSPPPLSPVVEIQGNYHGPPQKTSTLSNLLTVSLAILATTFFFFACYVIYKFFFSTWYNSRNRPWRSQPAGDGDAESGPDGFLDSDHGPVVDHPIWYIRTVGLDPSVIGSIAIVKYKKSDGLVEGTECSVCLTEFQENESLRMLPKCNHAFHIPCIDTWLRSHTNCPLCRARIVSGNTGRGRASAEDVIVPNAGRLEESFYDRAGVSAPENVDLDSRVGIEEEAESRARIGLKIGENCGEANGIQPTRRSVSMDPSIASVIRNTIADAPSARSDEISGLESVGEKETNGGIVERNVGMNRNLLRLVGSSSSVRSSLVGSSMKRSLSCSARLLFSR